ncbi:MAG: hypothetical protein FWE58_01455 [Methanobrevibacter sp.]|nr:hypothetical protein [Methanobrevibacter sp.]
MKSIIFLSTIILGIALFSLSSANVVDAASINNTTDGGIAQGVISAVADGTFILELADGVYTGPNNTNINITNNIEILGHSQNGTIINAGSLGRVFNATGYNLTLWRLTIMNGNAGGGYGGAIYSTGILTLNYVSFINNTAARGGAVWAQNPDNSTISNNFEFCLFINNSATDPSTGGGGALMLTGGYFWVSYSNFTNNTANNNGGAINKNNGTILIVSNDIFENNTAINGGAIYNTNSNLTVEETTFINNTATGSGGAIYSNTATATIITYSNFYNNSATLQGGAIFVRHTLNSTGSNYINNTASEGGGIYSYPDTGRVFVEYNRFVNNSNYDFYLNITSMTGTPDVNYNWWGDNTPLVYGLSLANWFVMQLSANNNINTTVNDTTTQAISSVNLSYDLVLFDNTTNTTSVVGYGVLPYFVVNLTWNGTGTSSEIVDARGYYSKIIDFTLASGFSLEAIGDLEDLILYQEIVYRNLTIVKTANVTNVIIGQMISYTITVTNVGDDTATNVWVNETLPGGLIYQGSTGDGTYNSANGTWYIGDLANGSTATITITVLVNQTGNINNIIALNLEEFNLGNNNTNVTINVAPQNTSIDLNAQFSNGNKTISLTSKLVDGSGNPIANTIVKFYINGVYVGESLTNANGIAAFNYTQINPFKEGTYLINSYFEGDTYYNPSNSSYTLILDTDHDNPNNNNTNNNNTNNNNTNNNNTNNNDTSGNSDIKASMKKTAVPINAILVLLSIIAIIHRRK